MTAVIPNWPPGSPRPATRRRTPHGGKVPGPASPRSGPGITLRITATCLAGCGWTDTGLSSDPPTTPKPSGWVHGDMGPKWDGTPLPWTRWAELDREAQRHEHPADVRVVPA